MSFDRLHSVAISVCLLMIFVEIRPPLFGQDDGSTHSQPAESPIVISDEPKTIDPAKFVIPQLAAPATIKFDGESLKKVFSWLQNEQKIPLQIDYNALANSNLAETEQVFDELKDDPVYLLLNRLQRTGLGWYERDRSIVITSAVASRNHERTIPYPVGDLIDAGYHLNDLRETIRRCCVAPAEKTSTDDGRIVSIGDSMLIRANDSTQREVAGLLAALRKPGRRTWILDAPGNDVLRSALQKKISVDFHETPLQTAVLELSRLSGISIRIDSSCMRETKIRERSPVNSKMSEQTLEDVLRNIFSGTEITWSVRDQVLWLIGKGGHDTVLFDKGAVFDVRDLCADQRESSELIQTLSRQTQLESTFVAPVPGVLALRHSEAKIDEVLTLLEIYREALRSSKFRLDSTASSTSDDDVVTGYYRVSLAMGRDLIQELPELILPDTWKSPERSDAIGTIVSIAADLEARAANQAPPQTVLMIRQTRRAHQSIAKLIRSLVSSKTVDLEASRDATPFVKRPNTKFGSKLLPVPTP